MCMAVSLWDFWCWGGLRVLGEGQSAVDRDERARGRCAGCGAADPEDRQRRERTSCGEGSGHEPGTVERVEDRVRFTRRSEQRDEDRHADREADLTEHVDHGGAG